MFQSDKIRNNNFWNGKKYNDSKVNISGKNACDLFLGNLPSDFTLSECFSLVEKFGRIFQIRMNLGNRMYNRSKGYAFIKLYDPIAAEEASYILNGYELRKGLHIRAILCRSQRRILIRNIPTHVSEKEIYQSFSSSLKGLMNVKTMVPVKLNEWDVEELNCSFAFVEFNSHSAAVKAMRILNCGKKKFWGTTLTANWMEPAVLRKEVVLTSVPDSMSEWLLIYLLQTSSKNGVYDYCWSLGKLYVRFRTNYQAVLAMKAINGLGVDGVPLKLEWNTFVQ